MGCYVAKEKFPAEQTNIKGTSPTIINMGVENGRIKGLNIQAFICITRKMGFSNQPGKVESLKILEMII